jgi:hypothetical protein
MESEWRMPARVAAGLVFAALSAFPQGYTISARPGAINYVEGTVSLDGKPLPAKSTAQMFLGANDTLTTAGGKAEVLLTPGVFVRLAENAEIRMISPRLTDTSFEVTKGEAIVEASELLQDNNIQILDHGAAVKLQKTGVYLFRAGDDAVARVFEGKAAVDWNGSHVELGKNHELSLVDSSKAAKFDAKSGEDDLYAWSKIRDEYEAASSYDASKRVHASAFDTSGYMGGYGGLGYGSGYGPGWLWNSGFNSWAWLPGDGAFFSPFGFGYYAPGFVSYAPVVYLPVGYGGGGIAARPVAVPVNPTKPVQIAGVTAARPMIPGHPAAQSTAFAYSGVKSNGGHVTGSSIVAAHSSAPSYSSGGGASSSGGGHYSSASSASSMPSASHSSGGAPSGGGGSHK